MHQCGKITPVKSPCLGQAKVADIVLVCVIIFPSYFPFFQKTVENQVKSL